jgi:hypothetical protein
MGSVRFAIASAAVILAGCGEGCPDLVTFAGDQPSWPNVAGAVVSYTLRVEVPPACHVPGSRVSLAVTGPSGEAVPVSVRAREDLVADATFTPEVAGNHHIRAALLPGGQRFDDHVTVLRPSAEARELHRLDLSPSLCLPLTETAAGTLVCGGALLRDGRVVARVAGSFVIAGRAIWTLGDGRVRRYVESEDGALRQDPPDDLSVAPAPYRVADEPPEQLIAREDDLVVAFAASLVRFRVAGGALVQGRPEVSFGGGRFGGRFTGERSMVVWAMANDLRARLRYCPVELTDDGGLRLRDDCPRAGPDWRDANVSWQPGAGHLMLTWWSSGRAIRYERIRVEPDRLVSAGSVYLHQRHVRAGLGGAIVETPEGLLAEELRLPPPFVPLGATRSYIVAQRGPFLDVRVFAR